MNYPTQNPNAGGRLLAQLQSAASLPPTMLAPPDVAGSLAPPPPAALLLRALTAAPERMPSSKAARGRALSRRGHAKHDVDSRFPGEPQPPQLEVTPITKYISDPGLLLGRQIAVNRAYIVYGLKQGNIRVLNINTALRSLHKWHTQRVTDMAFFAEDVHLLASASSDGRVFVWQIVEELDEENKSQITGRVVTAIQIVGDEELYHPMICWHSHKQEVLYVGVGNSVLRIDTTVVGKGREYTEEPIECHIKKLVNGVHLVGRHDGDVTDLSISQWMVTRLASSSKDGSVKIWDDRKLVPLTVILPHGGQAVYSVTFLTSPEHPNHINLITAGPLNRELKIWSFNSEEGWPVPSDNESWRCTQTLELVSSSDIFEDEFFNQVVVLPQASLILLANAKKKAIYALHVDYGPNPASTCIDYIADFSVAMPILSLTGICEYVPGGEQVIQVYCVQTMAIQQYALDLSRCLPSLSDYAAAGRNLADEQPQGESFSDSYVGGSANIDSEFPGSYNPSTSDSIDVMPSAPPFTLSDSNTAASDALAAELQKLGSSEADVVGFQTDVPAVHLHLLAPEEIMSGVLPSEGKHAHDVRQFTDTMAQDKVGISSSYGINPVTGGSSAVQDSYNVEELYPVDDRVLSESAETSSNAMDGKERAEDTLTDRAFAFVPSPSNSADSLNEPGYTTANDDAAFHQYFNMQDILQQLMTIQKGFPEQLATTIAIQVSEECKRIETSFAHKVEKSMKPIVEILIHFQEENARREKVAREHMQQSTIMITNCISKDLPATLERTLKNEISALGPVVATALTPVLEKSISTSIADSFQKGLGDKVVNQLEKSLSSKLDGMVFRQIQSQFNSTWKQALQEALRSCLESSIVPAFEVSCKTMFENVDSGFQNGMAEHADAIKQQLEAAYSPLAQTLKDTISTASSMDHNLATELLDGQRKIFALVAAGNSAALNPVFLHAANDPIPGLAEVMKVEVPVDPTKELSRLISELKYQDAFTIALQRNDVKVVSWLCSQVDLKVLCSVVPLPLPQGVLLALLQQLAFDIGNDTSRKVQWMTDVSVIINPADPLISAHMRPIFEQVYSILAHHRTLPTTPPSEAAEIRILMHVINSLLLSSK